MITVQVLLDPKGSSAQRRLLQEAWIANDARTTLKNPALGTYNVYLGHAFTHAPALAAKQAVWKIGSLAQWPRARRSPIELVAHAILRCFVGTGFVPPVQPPPPQEAPLLYTVILQVDESAPVQCWQPTEDRTEAEATYRWLSAQSPTPMLVYVAAMFKPADGSVP